MFELVLRGVDGSSRSLNYDPMTSAMVWADTNEKINLDHLGIGPAEQQEWKQAFPVHPTNPAKKSRTPKNLKIQMGLKCNYQCSYCNQAAQPHDFDGNPKQVDRFLKKLPTWFTIGEDHSDLRVEFWGGEPLVYWKTFKPLAEGVRKLYPDAQFSVITNGSLFTNEIVDWLFDLGFSVTVSHDGPAYEAGRGADPLCNEEQLKHIKYCFEKLGPHKFSFNCVLSAYNFSLDAVRTYIAEKMGIDEDSFTLWTEEILLPYDVNGVTLSVLDGNQALGLLHTVFHEAVFGKSAQSPAVMDKMREFAHSIRDSRPSLALGQKCGMDRPEDITIDLNGNVLTCQNTSPLTKHRIGHMEAFDHIRLNTAYHWTHREECMKCPLVQLCQGACLFLEGDLWKAACNNSFAYNMGILAASLYHFTGMVLVSIKNQDGIRYSEITEIPVINLVQQQ